MNIGELRAEIADLPDNMVLFVPDGKGGQVQVVDMGMFVDYQNDVGGFMFYPDPDPDDLLGEGLPIVGPEMDEATLMVFTEEAAGKIYGRSKSGKVDVRIPVADCNQVGIDPYSGRN